MASQNVEQAPENKVDQGGMDDNQQQNGGGSGGPRDGNNFRGRGGRGMGRGRGRGMGGPNRFSGGGDKRMSMGDNRDNKRPMQNDDSTPGSDKRPPRRMGHDMSMGPRGPGGGAERSMHEKLNQIMGATYDLPPLDTAEKKFSGRSRLYIGNIANDVTDEELNGLFQKFGETSELFINREKCFGFIRMDYQYNAAKAKGELDGYVLKGKTLKIRFSPNGSTLKVKNLDDCVTNELLYMAFSVFGELDRAVVIVDDRGKSTGEGIVEYARKPSAQFALRKCCEGCFFLTSSLRPVLVESYEALDETDGFADKLVSKRHPDYFKSRSVGPRFASVDSFENEYGMRWKQLFELYAQKEEALKKEMELDKEKLIAQMEFARYEHETEMLREQLRAREMDMDRHKHEWEMKQRQAEEARQRQDDHRRAQEEEMQAHMIRQEEEMRRRQEENNLFRQAHQLDSMLNQQEQAYNQNERRIDNYPEGGGNLDKPFMNNYNNRNSGGGDNYFDNRGGEGRNNRWGNDRDDFTPKRRRF